MHRPINTPKTTASKTVTPKTPTSEMTAPEMTAPEMTAMEALARMNEFESLVRESLPHVDIPQNSREPCSQPLQDPALQKALQELGEKLTSPAKASTPPQMQPPASEHPNSELSFSTESLPSLQATPKPSSCRRPPGITHPILRPGHDS